MQHDQARMRPFTTVAVPTAHGLVLTAIRSGTGIGVDVSSSGGSLGGKSVSRTLSYSSVQIGFSSKARPEMNRVHGLPASGRSHGGGVWLGHSSLPCCRWLQKPFVLQDGRRAGPPPSDSLCATVPGLVAFVRVMFSVLLMPSLPDAPGMPGSRMSYSADLNEIPYTIDDPSRCRCYREKLSPRQLH